VDFIGEVKLRGQAMLANKEVLTTALKMTVEPMAEILTQPERRRRWTSEQKLALMKGLAKALIVHVVLSTPGVVSRVCSDDERAMPKAVALVIAGTLLTSLPLLVPPLWGVGTGSHSLPIVPLAVVLLPQAIPLALPAALLFAIPLALRRQNPSGRLARRTVVPSPRRPLMFSRRSLTSHALGQIRPHRRALFPVWTLIGMTFSSCELRSYCSKDGNRTCARFA
jgi:hypothetical protein